VLHALAHINWNNTFRWCGCVTSLRRQGLRMIKPRLRHIHVQGAAGAGVCSAVSAGHPADNLERKRPRQNLRCRERRKLSQRREHLKEKKKRLFCSAHHLMLVMNTVNKSSGALQSLSIYGMRRSSPLFRWICDWEIGRAAFVYLFMHSLHDESA
jgi:hypothetical protein